MNQVSFERHGPVVVAVLAGDVDVANVSAVQLDVERVFTNDDAGLVVDLTSLRYLDSAGVQMLFDLARTLVTRRQAMAIALPEQSPLVKVLKIARLEEVVDIAASREEAIDAVRRSARPMS